MTPPQNSDPSVQSGLLGPAAVPIVLPSQKTAPPQRPKVARPSTTRVWNIDFAHLDMEQTVRLADDIVQARTPEYFITANLN